MVLWNKTKHLSVGCDPKGQDYPIGDKSKDRRYKATVDHPVPRKSYLKRLNLM